MVWWLFKKRDNLEQKFDNLHNSLHDSFSNIKKDIDSVNKWLGHFKNRHHEHDQKLELLSQRISTIEEVLEDMHGVWKGVQTAVQTGGLSKQLQTGSRPNSCSTLSKQLSKQYEELTLIEKIRKLTIMERAVVWALVNTDLKLSYEDLGKALGKDKSTLRGQINSIKTKSEDLIEEYPEKDGKKRFFISEKNKSEILKGVGQKENVVVQKVKKSKSEE